MLQIANSIIVAQEELKDMVGEDGYQKYIITMKKLTQGKVSGLFKIAEDKGRSLEERLAAISCMGE